MERPTNSAPPLFSVRTHAVAWVLAAAVGALALAGVGGQVLKYRFGHDHVFGLIRLFDLDSEMNVPTWYSSAILLVASVLLWTIGRARRAVPGGGARYWTGLAAIFLLMSVDEASHIHEMLDPVPRHVRLPALLQYSWVLAGAAAVAFVGLLYARFVLRLPPSTRRLFILSAALFVGGALGLELVEGAYASQRGIANLTYALLGAVEETLEMAGLSIFVYALVKELRAEGGVVLRIG